MFRYILLIKDNSVFINHLQWYWIRHYVFDWFIRLILIIVVCFLCHGISSVLHHFISHKKTRERESGCQSSVKNLKLELNLNLKSKVIVSFVKLVNYFCQSRYIYIIFHHSVRCHVHFPPYHHISELKSCCLSNIVVQRVQQTKLDSESFVNAYQFIRCLSVVFKKNSSVKDKIYLFCLSKCFGRSNT